MQMFDCINVFVLEELTFEIKSGQWTGQCPLYHVPCTKDSSLENHSSSSSSFENSPVPSYPEEGLHLSLLNPLPPQEGKDLKPGRLGLYEQTSSRPQGVARELLTQQSCECLTQYNCECLCAEGAAEKIKD